MLRYIIALGLAALLAFCSCGQSEEEIEKQLARVEQVYTQLENGYTLLWNPWGGKDSSLVTRKLTAYDSSVIEQFGYYREAPSLELFGLWMAMCTNKACLSNSPELPAYVVPAPVRTQIAFQYGWEEQYCCWCDTYRILEYKKDPEINCFYWFPFVQYRNSLERLWEDFILEENYESLDKTNPMR